MMFVYLQLLDSDDDRALFEKLYYRYRGYMYAIAFDILKNEDDAEDIVHQAFLSVINIIDRIESVDGSETKSLLYVIVKNKAIDFSKKVISSQIVYVDNDYDFPDFSAFDGFGKTGEVILAMPKKMKYILLLKFYHGFSTKEIATILDMKQSAVQKIIARAKEKIRKDYGEEV